jgi:hypothetical protein
MPTYRIVVKHHRNKKFIEPASRSSPAMYSSTCRHSGFVPVEAVEGVRKLLKYSRTYGEAPEPFSFHQEVIDRLRYMVWETTRSTCWKRLHACDRRKLIGR